MKNITAFGGDARTEYMAEYLKEKGFAVKKTCTLSDIGSETAVILPLPVTTDNKYIKGTQTTIS